MNYRFVTNDPGLCFVIKIVSDANRYFNIHSDWIHTLINKIHKNNENYVVIKSMGWDEKSSCGKMLVNK